MPFSFYSPKVGFSKKRDWIKFGVFDSLCSCNCTILTISSLFTDYLFFFRAVLAALQARDGQERAVSHVMPPEPPCLQLEDVDDEDQKGDESE